MATLGETGLNPAGAGTPRIGWPSEPEMCTICCPGRVFPGTPRIGGGSAALAVMAANRVAGMIAPKTRLSDVPVMSGLLANLILRQASRKSSSIRELELHAIDHIKKSTCIGNDAFGDQGIRNSVLDPEADRLHRDQDGFTQLRRGGWNGDLLREI